MKIKNVDRWLSNLIGDRKYCKTGWIRKIKVKQVDDDSFHCSVHGRNGKNLYATEPNGYTLSAAKDWVKNMTDSLKYLPEIIWK